MKRRRTIFWVIFISAAVISALVAYTKLKNKTAKSLTTTGPTGGPGSTPSTMTFGNPTKNCVGKGICHNSFSSNNDNSASGIQVIFTPVDANNVVMTFNINDLKNSPDPAQQNQAQYFSQPYTSYIFDFPFSLTNAAFGGMWKSGAMISSQSASRLSMGADGTTVIDSITITYSQPVQTNIIFGNQPAGGPADYTAQGICSYSPNPVTSPAAPNPPSSIPVNVSLQTGNAGVLVMTFNMSDINQNESQQVPLFKNNGTYTFSNTVLLNDLSLSGLILPPGAAIPAQATGNVSINSDNTVVTITVPYITQ